jgi:hypothetical protein
MISILNISKVSAEIIFRDTFEEDPSPSPWSENKSQEYMILQEGESDDPYQTQAHGEKSMVILDTSSTSYANATHSVSIPDTADEYMIEFYFWVPSGHDTIKDFPIMVPRHIGVSQGNH